MKVLAPRPLWVVVNPEGELYFQPGRGLSVFENEDDAADFHHRECSRGSLARKFKFVPEPRRKARRVEK